MAAALQITRTDGDDGTRIRLSGSMRLDDGQAAWDELKRHLQPAGKFNVDLSGLDALDGAGAALLLELRAGVEARGGTVSFSDAPADAARLLDLYGARPGGPAKPPPSCATLLCQIGDATSEILLTLRHILGFIGGLTRALARAVRQPRTVNWRDIPQLMERAGADAVPIVLLINFLIGLVIGLQTAIQLKTVGVGVYIADVVGKSVTRELGPLMTAIIVAGRSGAAYAAELGTMKVSEEVDALRTLGFDPLRFLVVPRVIALTAMLPLLTLLGDFIACLGGFFVGIGYLGLTPLQFQNQLFESLTLWDVFGGIIKAAVFAIAITLIACQRGLATRGGAAGVGSSTTSAVVVILFYIILLNALLTLLYTALDI